MKRGPTKRPRQQKLAKREPKVLHIRERFEVDYFDEATEQWVPSGVTFEKIHPTTNVRALMPEKIRHREARRRGAAIARANRPKTEARDLALASFAKTHAKMSAEALRRRLQTNATDRAAVLGSKTADVPSVRTIQRAVSKFRVT